MSVNMLYKLVINRLITTAFSAICLILIVFTQVQAQNFEKKAQTSFKFLSVSLDGKASGLSEAITSLEGGAESMFYNPAAMSRMDGALNIAVSNVSFIADIKYNSLALAFKPLKGRYGVIGINLLATDYGDFEETIRYEGNDGYQKLGFFNPRAYSVGISYARAVTNQFSVGGTVKYVDVNLVNGTIGYNDDGSLNRNQFATSTIAYDFGVHYLTGFKSLKLAFSVRNFSQEINFDEENSKDDSEIPLTMRMGVSMDLMDLFFENNEMNALLISLDANRPIDFNEQIYLGLEYTFMKMFSLRSGSRWPSVSDDERGFTYGAGISQALKNYRLTIDYSYMDYGVFNGVNTFSVKFSF